MNELNAAPMTDPSALVRPFTVAVFDSEIEDLKQRLARTRWPNPETVSDWSQGVRLENARSLIDYWERDYDWRRFESELNRFPHFLTAIDGLDVHFIHVKSANPSAMPLILTHGWPGSIVELLKLIGPLTDPVAFGGGVEDSFDVVIPSLPGFGFSGKPSEPGWDVTRIAHAWVAISLYWYTNSAVSSARIYWENGSASFAGPKLTLPVAVTVFPRDIPRLPRSWIEDTYSNLIHYGEASRGGHFAAFEQPEILISEIRAGLRGLRS